MRRNKYTDPLGKLAVGWYFFFYTIGVPNQVQKKGLQVRDERVKANEESDYKTISSIPD